MINVLMKFYAILSYKYLSIYILQLDYDDENETKINLDSENLFDINTIKRENEEYSHKVSVFIYIFFPSLLLCNL